MFSAYTPMAGGQVSQREFSRKPVFDTVAELNFSRLPSYQATHPYPQVIGFVQGLLPLANEQEYAMMLGRTPFGPWMGPDNTMPQLSAVFPNIQGGLPKVTG